MARGYFYAHFIHENLWSIRCRAVMEYIKLWDGAKGQALGYDSSTIILSGIAGITIITINFEILKDKKIIVFTVGLASTNKEEVFLPIIEKNSSKEMRDNIKFFHLRDGINYKKLGIIHKSMMAMLKIIISKKGSDELSDDDRELLATYGKKVDFTDKNMIKPLLSFLES